MNRKAVFSLFAVALMTLAFAAAAIACGDVMSLPGFNSPSGNIRCFYLSTSRELMCSIHQASYSQNLQDRCLGPNGEGVDWHGWSLSPSGKGEVRCSGGILYNPDTQQPTYVTLPYGKTWRQGAFTCTSRITGVTCRSRSGHGLFIARAAWRTW